VDKLDQPSVLGKSLRLADGDLVLAGGDLATVAGQDNFLQALQVMIETPFASDVFNVNYGFDVQSIFTAALTVNQVKDLIRLNIVKSVSQDNRVQQVNEVVFDDEPRFYEILPDQEPGDHEHTRQRERRWQAVVVLQAVPEGQVALRLEGVRLSP